MIVESKQVQLYVTSDGRIPYEEWIEDFSDQTTRDRIDARATRLALGHLGKCKPVGGGVTELIVDFGPSYRIYVGQVGSRVILLLCGGDKSTQQKDIAQAREYWEDYKEREKKEREREWHG